MITDIHGNKVPDDAFIIRHTELAQFLQCPRKWAILSHNGLNLEPIQMNHNLSLGIIWHTALEEYYRALQESKSDPYTAGRLALQLKAVEQEEHLQLTVGDPMGGLSIEDQDKKEQDRGLLEQMYDGYVDWSNNYAKPNDKDFRVVDVERRFLVPILTRLKKKAAKAYLAVKIDTIVEYNKGLWVVEHKTAGKSTKVDDIPGLELDIQLALQALALKRTTSVPPVKGIIYNVARKQAPSNRVKSPLFGRTIVTKSPTELENMELFLHSNLLEMKKVSRMVQEDGMDALGRIKYVPNVIGNGSCIWGCPVRDICESVNRGDDLETLMSITMRPREKTIKELLEEEMEE